MQVVRTVQTMVKERALWTAQVGFVPTMGYLHAGHLSLCQQARAENQILVVSIFVNPTQFDSHDDLSRYPRDLDHDLHMLETLGVDVVFAPTTEEMYPPGFTSYVDLRGPLSEQGEGESRPGHFRGVATVVLKLFQLVQPHHAYFGQKDAQQASTSRAAATVLYRALQAGRAVFDAHPSAAAQAVIQAMIDIVTTEPLARLDYAQVRDPATFQPLETLQAPALLLIAASVGPARLIDNFVLHADGAWDTGRLASEERTRHPKGAR